MPVSGRPGGGRAAQTPDLKDRVKDEARAAGSGFVDGLSAGTADYVSAVLKLAGGQGGPGSWPARYGALLEAERQQDRYDQANFGGARLAGQGVGTVAGIGLTGGALGGLNALRGVSAIPAAARLAPNFGHVVRVGALAGGGTGAAGQAVADSLTGRLSAPTDYLGAIAAGALGGAAAPYVGTRRAAVLAGAAGPWLQATLAGSNAQPAEAIAGALLGPIGVRRVEAGVAAAFNRLAKDQKQAIGEQLSLISSFTRGERPVGIQRRTYLKGGGYTVADHVTKKHVIEAKAGEHASLSMRQRQARRELENYIVEHWLPQDLGAMASMSLVGLGAPVIQVPTHMMLSAERQQAREAGR
jgi:hypothetical protein